MNRSVSGAVATALTLVAMLVLWLAPILSPPLTAQEAACTILSPGPRLAAADLDFSDVMGLRLLGNGGFVVPENDTPRLRFFSPDGTLLHTAGREGAGPGEYRSIAWIQMLPGDTVVVFDIFQRRLSYLDGAGRFLKSEQIQVPPVPTPPGSVAPIAAQPVAVRTDGSVWALGAGLMQPTGRQALLTTRSTLLHLTPERVVGATLGPVALHELFETAGASRMPYERPPFWRRALFATDGARLYFAEGQGPVIAVFDGGRRSGTLRAPIPERAVTADVRRRHAANDDWPYQFPRVAPYPPVIPALDALFADRDGRLWAREYPAPGDRTHRWHLFANPATDQAVAVCVDAQFHPHDARGARVLGIWTDEDGVQTPREYRWEG